ncbi:ABC transporter ATP-binding protein [Mycolicibacterium sp. P9-22]|uniref:ABC transporter ATP-binding protein n=1 Tax=Mycolicibacterium sp. P9-22 TaxID=2024613 RepID=UPI0011EED6DC|nr:ATP-binding cassette domain-containing protein [Mycolicibacterium sp. P9-22]KAA0118678.1 ATP-binding cassette domain-containing protein [Mycolicibacterium sp. P9-22]
MNGVRAAGVSVSFGGTVVLDGVDLDAPPGTITGVTGASGSGKTTLLRVLAGLQVPDRGTVHYGAAPVAPTGSIALLAQHPRLVCNPRWTLRRIIAEPATIRGAPDTADELAVRVGLDAALLQRYPGQVSDGQVQRACLARVLGQSASTVLCDEPTAMLDPIASSSVLRSLQEIAAGGAVVIVVSHDPELIAALADRQLSLSPG